ncbi:metallophosphoesterase family protein [Pseudonocardia hydrocarbonoxydans]|uniref:Calcineurin-like phosphoesterase domain-containing protein n=1 Tax=Pseudonocardia hydrocarbonoxydans TaxID=76726 RepID=A0A4Y3WJC0_9PSEU|nr:hypothetical protein [Pseudonocardia hydrocarbonoxydans]GEC18618.1 hypothetical protein PHY01_09010 [Pseudonocardia hydrocarbonoxydans]
MLDGPTRLVPVLGNHDVVRGEQDAQTAWLDRALAVPDPPGAWTIVAMHHPAFSAGAHGTDADVLDLRARWAPIFARHRVPLVLAGQVHDHQRSRPQDGVTYVVSGAAAKLRPTESQPFTAVSTSTRHFLDLAVHPDRLELRAVDQDGRLVDTVTRTRPR